MPKTYKVHQDKKQPPRKIFFVCERCGKETPVLRFIPSESIQVCDKCAGLVK